MVVETMGRETGWLALFGGLAGGADYIIIPEVPYKIEDVAAHIEKRKKEGKNFSIVVVAEGAPLPEGREENIEKDDFGHPINSKRRVGYTIMEELEKLTGIKSRTTVLGYIQRGGMPTNTDRILATRLGNAAVEFADNGKFNGVVGIRNGEIVLTPLAESAGKIHKADTKFYELARIFF
jgi:6-phosphofructokinase